MSSEFLMMTPGLTHVPFVLVGDPKKALYKEFGVETSLGFMSLKALDAGMRGMAHGHLACGFREAHWACRATQVPDHKFRLEASRAAVALLGGVPKVGEGTPTAHGLNLFVSVRGEQAQRPLQVADEAQVPPRSN